MAVLPAGVIALVVSSVVYLLTRRLLSCLVLMARHGAMRASGVSNPAVKLTTGKEDLGQVA